MMCRRTSVSVILAEPMSSTVWGFFFHDDEDSNKGPVTCWVSALPLSSGSNPVWHCMANALILRLVVILSTANDLYRTCLVQSPAQDHPDGLVALSLLRVEGIDSHRALDILKNG